MRLSRRLLLVSSSSSPPPVSGWPGQPSNPVGYAAYSGFTGSLTAMSVSSIVSNTTYNNKLFDNGTSSIGISATNSIFNGCYFGASTGATNSEPHTSWSGGNNVCNYCTFGPSPSVIGGTFPPQAGGYSTWPTGTTQTLSIAHGNDYGIVGTGGSPPPTGGLIFNSCDAWGFSNGVVFSKTNSSNPLTFDNCWFHDSCITPSGFHTDGIGDVQSESVDYVENLTINNCTIAVICNSNNLSFQPNSPSEWLFNNNTFTNNYLTSTASYVVQSGIDRTTSPATNIKFIGNTFSAYLACDFGIFYENDTSFFSTSGSGNEWRNNKILPGTYAQVGNVTSSIPYLWPNATANSTDFTGPF